MNMKIIFIRVRRISLEIFLLFLMVQMSEYWDKITETYGSFEISLKLI